MAFESSLPAPTVSWVREYIWPAQMIDSGFSGAGPPLETHGTVGPGEVISGGAGAVEPFFDGDNGTSGAGGTFVMAFNNGVWGVRCKQATGQFAVHSMNQVMVRGPLVSAALPAGFINPELNRVALITVQMLVENIVDNPTDETGFKMLLTNAAGVGSNDPTDGAVASQLGGLGFVGDGAGGFIYRTWEQAPAYPGNILNTTALPSFVVGEWNTLEIEFIFASGARDGSVQAFLNGAQVASHGFASGDLPVYGTGPGGNPTTGFEPSIRAEGDVWVTLGGFHLRMGRFTRQGLELSS